MKHHYKIQTIFDTHTCTALCTKLFCPLSTAVNVLPFQLLPCTFHSGSDISHLTSALTTQETQTTVERNRINTQCAIYASQSSHALCTKTSHMLYHKCYLYRLDDPWVSQQGQDMFLFSNTSRTALAPTQPPLNGYHRLLPLGYSRGSIKLTTHLHLTPRRMSQAIHLLPSWCGQLDLSPLPN